jgi:hypothetical protein
VVVVFQNRKFHPLVIYGRLMKKIVAQLLVIALAALGLISVALATGPISTGGLP